MKAVIPRLGSDVYEAATTRAAGSGTASKQQQCAFNSNAAAQLLGKFVNVKAEDFPSYITADATGVLKDFLTLFFHGTAQSYVWENNALSSKLPLLAYCALPFDRFCKAETT